MGANPRPCTEVLVTQNSSSPLSRRSLFKVGGAFAGAVGTLSMLEKLAWIPERVALADTTAATVFPDIQFDIGAFTAPARNFDGVMAALPPVNTVFLTASLSRAPSKADQGRMENALKTIEA